jgi:hypothetical protein
MEIANLTQINYRQAWSSGPSRGRASGMVCFDTPAVDRAPKFDCRH